MCHQACPLEIFLSPRSKGIISKGISPLPQFERAHPESAPLQGILAYRDVGDNCEEEHEENEQEEKAVP